MKNQFENSGAGSHWNIKRVIESNAFKGVKNFDDLQKNIAQIESTVTKGSAWEIFRKFYMTQVRGVEHFWYSDQIPIEVLNKLKIPADDKGIDCAYYDVDGTLVAGQDKFRSNSKDKITWCSLATFFGLAEYAPHRSIFTSGNGVSSVLNTKDRWSLTDNFSKVTKGQWLSIYDWLIGGRRIKTPKLENRPHQTKAINSNVKMFNSGYDRLTNILPCGAGKTAIAIKTLTKLNPKVAVLYFPSVGLVDQTQKEFVKHHLTTLYNYFSVTHDTTVTADMELYNDVAYDCDFPVTTKPDELKSKIDEALSKDKRVLIFSTYQSADVVTEACKRISFDLGIFDEAHWTVGSRSKPYSQGLFNSNVKISKRLFLTATPTWNQGCPTLFNSMDNTELYGERNVTMNFREAIDQGIICDYELITSEVESENINRELINTSKVPIDGKLERSRLVSDCLSLKKAMDQFGFSKTFVFYNRNDPAKDFRNLFEKMNPEVECFYLDSKTKSHKRKLILKSFSDAKKAILVNVNVVSEGIDCPNVDCVFFAQPKKSARIITQAVGRPLRPYPNKNKAYILISTYVQKTDEEDISEALHESKYQVIGDVAVALAQYDEQWRELLQQVIRESAIGPRETDDGGDTEINFPQLRYFDVKSSLLLRSILSVIPTHRVNFDRLQEIYEREGNWRSLTGTDWKKNHTKSLVTFIGNLRNRGKAESSLYHPYYNWLLENNFPLSTEMTPEYYNDYFFMSVHGEIVEALKTVNKFSEFDKGLKDRIYRMRSEKFKNKFHTKKHDKILDDLIGKNYSRNYRISQNIECVKNNPNSSKSKKIISGWRCKLESCSDEKRAMIKKIFKQLGIKEKLPSHEENLLKKISEWKKLKDDPNNKKFSDGTDIALWVTTNSNTKYRNRHSARVKKAFKDAGFITDRKEEKTKKAIEGIKRLKYYEDKDGNLNAKNLPQKDANFLHALDALRRNIESGRRQPTPYAKEVLSEAAKQLKTFGCPETFPRIKQVKQVSKAGTVSRSYAFNVTFKSITKTYACQDVQELERRRSLVLKAKGHIAFPRRAPANKGLKKR